MKKSTYWKQNKHLVYRVNASEILKQEEVKGVPVFKQGRSLMKEITQRKPRYYIPNPFRGNKKNQLIKGAV